MNINRIYEHLAIIRNAEKDLLLLADIDAFRKEGILKETEFIDKENILLESYAQKVASLIPVNFPESNVNDISDTPEGKEAVALMHNLVNNFGKNVRS